MELIKMIETILEQKNSFRPILVDIKIANGNILLRSFHITELDKNNNSFIGMTYQESYVHSREDRDPILSHFYLNEIKELFCSELNIHFSQDSFHSFSSGNFQ
jgi:hypothetical protein